MGAGDYTASPSRRSGRLALWPTISRQVLCPFLQLLFPPLGSCESLPASLDSIAYRRNQADSNFLGRRQQVRELQSRVDGMTQQLDQPESGSGVPVEKIQEILAIDKADVGGLEGLSFRFVAVTRKCCRQPENFSLSGFS